MCQKYDILEQLGLRSGDGWDIRERSTVIWIKSILEHSQKQSAHWTEPQLLTCSRTVNSASIPVQWTEDHLSQLHLDSGQVYPGQWTENHLAQQHLNTWVFPAFTQPTQLIIDRNLTEMIIYSGVSYFFWEWRSGELQWLIHVESNDRTSIHISLQCITHGYWQDMLDLQSMQINVNL